MSSDFEPERPKERHQLILNQLSSTSDWNPSSLLEISLKDPSLNLISKFYFARNRLVHGRALGRVCHVFLHGDT